MANAAMGHQARFGAGSTATVDHEFEFLSNGLVDTKAIIQSDGMHGSRARRQESVVEGLIAVGGTVVIEPRSDDLDYWLPNVMGTGTNPTFGFAEELPAFYCHSVKGMKNPIHNLCYINTARFSSRAGQPLQLALDIQGTSVTLGTSFPSIAASLSTRRPYIHHELVCTLGGSPYKVDNVELTINNALKTDRYWNTQTRQGLPATDYQIGLSIDFPFTTDEASLYDIATAGVTGTLVWTKGTVSCTATFAALQAPLESPPVQSRGAEVGFRVNFQGRKTGSTAALVWTNDSTV